MTRADRIDWTLDLGVLGEQDVEILYDYSPGAPEQGPTYSSGGQPADPPEVTITQIFILVGTASVECSWMIDQIDSDEMDRIHEHIIEVENETWEE